MMKTRLVVCSPYAEWQRVRQHEIPIALSLHQGALETLKCVAIIVGQDGLPNWPATDYLLECAIASQSITGDTVRTYGESLTAWIRHRGSAAYPSHSDRAASQALSKCLTNTNPKLSPFTIRARVPNRTALL